MLHHRTHVRVDPTHIGLVTELGGVRQGPDAEATLNLLSGNNIAVPVGQCVYTQWMNARGGIQADVTVTRLAEDRFLVVAAEMFHRRVEAMLHRGSAVDARVQVTDFTSGYTLLSVQGPGSRAWVWRCG